MSDKQLSYKNISIFFSCINAFYHFKLTLYNPPTYCSSAFQWEHDDPHSEYIHQPIQTVLEKVTGVLHVQTTHQNHLYNLEQKK